MSRTHSRENERSRHRPDSCEHGRNTQAAVAGDRRKKFSGVQVESRKRDGHGGERNGGEEDLGPVVGIGTGRKSSHQDASQSVGEPRDDDGPLATESFDEENAEQGAGNGDQSADGEVNEDVFVLPDEADVLGKAEDAQTRDKPVEEKRQGRSSQSGGAKESEEGW